MLIEKPRECDVILKDSLKIFKDKFFLNSKAKKELSFLFFEYCLKDLELKNVELTFKKASLNEKGSCFGNKIEIIMKNFRFNQMLDVFDTISHEVRHIKQHSYLNHNKSFSYRDINKYPIELCPGNLPYLQIADFDSFSYYLTSNNEKDARDYANYIIKKFFTDLLNLSDSRTLSNKLKKLLNKIEKNIEKENVLYNKHLSYVNLTYRNLKEIVTQQIELRISFFNNYFINREYDKCKSFKMVIQSLLLLYSDDNLIKKITDFAMQINDEETLFICLNHQNTNISKDTFKKIFTYLINNKKLSKNEIFSKLNYWDNETLKNFSSEFNQNNKKYKLKKILYNNLNYFISSDNNNTYEKTL